MKKTITISINTIEALPHGAEALEINNSNITSYTDEVEQRKEQLHDIEIFCECLGMYVHACDVVGKGTSLEMLKYILQTFRTGVDPNFRTKNILIIKYDPSSNNPISINKMEGSAICTESGLRSTQHFIDINCLIIALIENIKWLEASNPSVYKRDGIIATCIETIEDNFANADFNVIVNNKPSNYITMQDR